LAINRAIERLRAGRETQSGRRRQVERELSLTESRLARLANALAEGDSAPMPTLVAKLKTEEARKQALLGRLEALTHGETITSIDGDRIRETVCERAANLRGVLERTGPEARMALAKILVGKLDAEPVVVEGRHGYRLKGQINISGLLPDPIVRQLQSRAANSPLVVAPTGFEPVFPHRRALLPTYRRLAAR
jgi:hypothetical protein